MTSTLKLRLSAFALGVIASATMIAGNAFAGHHFENHFVDNSSLGASDHRETLENHDRQTMLENHGGKDLLVDKKVVIVKQIKEPNETITLVRSGDRFFEVVVRERDGRRIVKVTPVTQTSAKSLIGKVAPYDVATNGIN